MRVWVSTLAIWAAFANAVNAQGSCPAYMLPDMKWMSPGGFNVYIGPDNQLGFDSWDELEAYVRRGTIARNRAIPGWRDYTITSMSIMPGNAEYQFSVFSEPLGQTLTGVGSFSGFRYYMACPAGYYMSGSYCFRSNSSDPVCPGPGKEIGAPDLLPQSCSGDDDSLFSGNPINTATGNKIQIDQDYKGRGANFLRLERTYNSGSVKTDGFDFGWRSNFARSIAPVASNPTSETAVYRPDGQVFFFYLANGNWLPKAMSDRGGLVELKDVNGNRTGWRYTNLDDEIEDFLIDGRLSSIVQREGRRTQLIYGVDGALTQVADDVGRVLLFTYSIQSVDLSRNSSAIGSVIDPQGWVYGYTSNVDGYSVPNMKVTYPDGRSRIYLFNETNLYQPISRPRFFALTGLLDENAQRYATWNYDTSGRAVSSEHAAGVETFQVLYGLTGESGITQPNGATHTKKFTTIGGRIFLEQHSQPAGSGCAAAARSLAYDGAGNPIMRDHFDGKRTCSVYDARNLEIVRVEGLANTVACPTVTSAGAVLPSGSRKVVTTWHPDWRLPIQVNEPLLRTTTVYHGQPDSFNGNTVASCTTAAPLPNGKPVALLCKQVKQSVLSDGSLDSSTPPSITSYSYDSLGSMLTKTDPLGRVTSYAYYAVASFTGADPNSVGYSVGDLQSVTNPAGQITQYPLYDKSGRVKQMIDPKGVVTDISYTPRGWVSTVTTTAPGGTPRSTTYTYDGVGQLTGVSQPDGSTLSYSYDAAHRLVGVTDAKGNSVTYTLDNAGNRVAEETKDSTGALQRSIGRSFDALNRVQQVTGASR